MSREDGEELRGDSSQEHRCLLHVQCLFVNDPGAYPPDADVTERLKVPGGWIYRNVHYSLADLEKDADQPAQVAAVAMCFVPETR